MLSVQKRYYTRAAVVGLLCLRSLLASAEPVWADQRIDYSRDIRPILATKCFTCHGPDEQAREAGLRLDHRSAALLPLESGARAIVPGDTQQSELLARVISPDDGLRMPPAESGKELSPAEIDLLRHWIAEGAAYAEHWSFSPVRDVEAPRVGMESWIRNEIDAFVLARLEAAGLSPSPEADRRRLLRRLSLDLIGLPPTPEEVEEFARDERPDAYESQVEKLLASPHFGERWGRHWLDLARYADSNGYLGDEFRPQAYRYRDWVISAINQDLPYDQFTIEQIAGDLLPEATQQQKIATGLHANAMVNTEAGVDREADRVIQTVDRLNTVGTAWLGLTIACAECHAHKYDPISQREFYQMYAFFNTLEPDNLVIDVLPAPKEDEAKKQARLEKMQQLEAQLRERLTQAAEGREQELQKHLGVVSQPVEARAEADREGLEHWLAELDAEAKKWVQDFEKLALQQPRPIEVKALSVRERTPPRITRIHHRGDFRQPGEVVQPATPAFLPPLHPRGATPDRLDLARWLVQPEHPLTARTAVNHVWQHLFGRGLVTTADNFGTTGSEPSHPELLDWLAGRFREGGWSRKALIRLIVTSSTYRQDSVFPETLQLRDPENILLARQSRLRLEGEIVRDVALSVSGLLNRRIGGPSIKPPLNSRITQVSRNQEWKVSSGTEKYRRGLYILFRRATPYPMLSTFDAPASTASCPARERSNSPLQALTMLNDPVFWECAQHLGRKLAGPGDASTRDWLRLAVRETLSREPLETELSRLEQLYQEYRDLLARESLESLRVLTGDDSPRGESPELAARVLVARSLMNLEEFITRE